MPDPISLCLENEEDPDDGTRFIRCVALEGNRAGLAVDPGGRPMWMDTDGCACELWVSADEQLILLRPEGAVASRVHRAGRSLDVPPGKPVVMLDQDQIEVAGVMLRLHVHGFAEEIHPPTPFVPPRAPAAALAAAMLLGAAAGCDRTETPGSTEGDTGTLTAATTTTTESITTTSSDTASRTETSSTAPTATGASSSTGRAATTQKPVQTKPPIEVRPRPPAPVRRDPPKGDPDPLL